MAALTIPSLIVKNQEKETVVRLKKVYNVFSNAYTLARTEYGPVEDWDIGNDLTTEGAIKLMNLYAAHLNLNRRCDKTRGCFDPKGYKYKDGTLWQADTDPNVVRAILGDGTNFAVRTFGSGCNSEYGGGALKNSCGIVYVDINGFKGPNKVGEDLFSFFITKSLLVPSGTKEEKNDPLKTQCLMGTGWGCAAWVLLKENMDYPSNGWEE